MRACADPAREDGWITQPFIDAYTRLHELGWAHSVEVFDRDGLAGGLYGVRINGLFAGESMFHARRDASKVALMALVQLMRDAGMTLLDVQWRTDHLESLGAVEVSRDQVPDPSRRRARRLWGQILIFCMSSRSVQKIKI